MREIIEGIRAEVPGLMIGVRLSVFDTVPYRPRTARHRASPIPATPSGFGFGVLGDRRHGRGARRRPLA